MAAAHEDKARDLLDAFIERHRGALILVGEGAFRQPADGHLNDMLQQNLVVLDRFLRVRQALARRRR